eukprot:gene15601-18535_t
MNYEQYQAVPPFALHQNRSPYDDYASGGSMSLGDVESNFFSENIERILDADDSIPIDDYDYSTPTQQQPSQQKSSPISESTSPCSNNGASQTIAFQSATEMENYQLTVIYYKLMQYSGQLCGLSKQVYQYPYLVTEENDSFENLGALIVSEIANMRSILKKRGISRSSYEYPESPNGANLPQQYYCGSDSDKASKKSYAKTLKSSPTYINLTENMIKAQTKKSKKPVNSNRSCLNCKTTETPEWRRGPQGAKTLCNACGIRYRLSKQIDGASTPTHLSNGMPLIKSASEPIFDSLPTNLVSSPILSSSHDPYNINNYYANNFALHNHQSNQFLLSPNILQVTLLFNINK